MSMQLASIEPTRALVLYEEACRAIAECKSIREAKVLRDKAEALRCFAVMAKTRELEIDATEVRHLAERRLGELLIEHSDTVGFNDGRAGLGRPSLGGALPEPPKDVRPTLEDMGIDKKLSARAQKIARMPEEDFEKSLGAWRHHVVTHKARVSPLFTKHRAPELKLRMPTRAYMQLMDEIEQRRVERGLSMEQVSECMGSAERSYAKMLRPETPSSRMVSDEIIQLALDALWPEGWRLSIESDAEHAVSAGTMRKILHERELFRERHA